MIIGFKYNSVYYIGLLLTVFAWTFSASRALGQPGPKLEIDHSEFDFGRIPGPGTVELRTWIRSTGSADLEIIDIKSGCGCISSYTDKEVLAPGDSAEIVLAWSVRDTAGTAARQVYVLTNAGSGVARIEMTAMVGGFGEGERVEIDPERIRTSPRRALARGQIVRLSNKLGEACSVIPLLTGQGIRLLIPDSLKAGETMAIGLEFEEKAVNQPFETSFTLEISSGSGFSRRITVPVTVGDFSYKPTYVRTTRKN